MAARAVPVLPANDRELWSYEPKFDGARSVIFVEPGRVRIQSRQYRALTEPFSDVVAAVAGSLEAGTVVDGELVVMAAGRLDFLALQRRLASRRVRPDAPATLVVFDLLAYRSEDLRPLPQGLRRARLEQLLGDAHGTGVALMPATGDLVGARAWMGQDAPSGIEGVVAKRVDQGYLPRRNHWLKHRATETTEAIVGGVVGMIGEPSALVLGLPDQRGRLKVIGRTHRLSRARAAELGPLLRPPAGPHPWPIQLPSGRVGLPGGPPVAHTPVAPEVVVEIRADRSWEAGRYRHGVTYLRPRLDLQPSDLAERLGRLEATGWTRS
jgi:ATP-dependent DNA ligase